VDWVTWIGILMLLGGLSAIFDNMLKQETIKRISNEIINLWVSLEEFNIKKRIQSANNYFIILFDAIYGKKHFSRRTFFRSCLSSLFALTLALTICFLIERSYIEDFISISIEEPLFPIILVFLNIVADYFSLIETRLVLAISRNRSLLSMVAILIMDIVATLCCYAIFLIIPEMYFLESAEISDILLSYEMILDLLYGSIMEMDPLTPYVYSTFFTSFIFYCFLFSAVFIKVINLIRKPLLPIIERVSLSENPFKALSALAAALVIIIEGMRKIIA
jgi:hypothetical protein